MKGGEFDSYQSYIPEVASLIFRFSESTMYAFKMFILHNTPKKRIGNGGNLYRQEISDTPSSSCANTKTDRVFHLSKAPIFKL